MWSEHCEEGQGALEDQARGLGHMLRLKGNAKGRTIMSPRPQLLLEASPSMGLGPHYCPPTSSSPLWAPWWNTTLSNPCPWWTDTAEVASSPACSSQFSPEPCPTVLILAPETLHPGWLYFSTSPLALQRDLEKEARGRKVSGTVH